MKNSMACAILLGLALGLLLAGCGGATAPTARFTNSPIAHDSSPIPTSTNTPGPLPGDIPVYSGAQLLVEQSITTGILYFYRVAASPQTVSNFYLDQMPRQGWTQDSAESNDDQGGMYLVYTKGDRSVMMNIVLDPMIGADTDISIILSNS